MLNPLTVRRTGNGGYELVAGERRLRAARVAGLTDVPCLLINADGEDSSVIALVENLQRRDLDFFEEANGFKRLIEQFGLTQEELAERIDRSPAFVGHVEAPNIKKAVSLDTLFAIAQALDVPAYRFLIFDDSGL